MAQLTSEIIAAAQAAQRKYGVPASVTLAQFGLESAWGTRMPAGSNNPFGIKAKVGEPSVPAKTREVVNGKSVFITAQFRKFADFAEAFDAHGALFVRVSLYSSALAAWRQGKLMQGIDLMAQHYATDPHYASSIRSLIAADNLTRYDVEWLGEPKAAPAPQAQPAKWDWLSEAILALLALFGIRRR